MNDPTHRETVRIPSEIWILTGAALVIAVGYGLVAPVLPSYARSFDVGVMGATIIVSAFAFFRLAFAPVGGVLLERLGERPVYISGLLVVAVSSLASGLAQTYWQLLIFRGLGGVGSVMFTISAMALVVRLAPPGIRGRVSSVWGASFLIGSMVGPLLGGLVAGWGMRVPFFAYAALLVVAALVVGIALSGARLRPPPTKGSQEVMSLSEAWSNPAYRAAIVSSAANGWANMGVRNAIIPLLAAAVLDRTWTAGLVLAAGAVGTAVVLPVTARLADRIGRRPLLLVGQLVAGISLALMGLVLVGELSTPVALGVLMLLSFVGGAGGGLVGPALQAAVGDIIGSERNGGRVLSTYQMAADGGVILGPILIGAVADRCGFPLALALSGAVALVGVPVWWRAPETLREEAMGHR